MKNQEDKLRRHELDDGREGGRKTGTAGNKRLSVKGQLVTFLDFAGKMVSVATTQLCHFRTEKGNK